jgi:hypothetical protein
MTDEKTHHRGHLVRQILLVPAVVMVLITAAAPAGAARLTGPMGVAHSARTAAIARGVDSPLGRKVG